MKGENRPGVDWRTVLKMTGAAALTAGAGSVVGQQQQPPATLTSELEGVLRGVNLSNGTINVMGVRVNAQNATLSTPTTTLTRLQQLRGNPFPGRTRRGFLGGTAIVTGTTAETGGVVTADDVFVEVAENVLLGPVTRNTIPSGGSLGDSGTVFRVQGIQVRPIGDRRMPLVAVIEDTDFVVDLSTVPTGSLAGVEGYYVEQENVLYAHTIETETGTVVGGPQISINLVRCSGTRLEVRGVASVTSGTVTIRTGNTQETQLQERGSTTLTPDDTGTIGQFRFRTDGVANCPSFVRAALVDPDNPSDQPLDETVTAVTN